MLNTVSFQTLRRNHLMNLFPEVVSQVKQPDQFAFRRGLRAEMFDQRTGPRTEKLFELICSIAEPFGIFHLPVVTALRACGLGRGSTATLSKAAVRFQVKSLGASFDY